MIGDILTKMLNALAGNSEITAYCADKFSKTHQVYLGQNPENPPDESKAPIIVISIIEGTERNDQGSLWRIQIRIGIKDEVIENPPVSEEDGAPLSNKFIYRGFVRCYELTELAETAILLLSYKMRVATESVPNDVFPLFTSKITVLIEKNTPIRGVVRKGV